MNAAIGHPTDVRVQTVLSVSSLSVEMRLRRGGFLAVRDVSFHLDRGEIVGIVGESGCGKSSTALAIMRLLPSAAGVVDGNVQLNGRELFSLSEHQMRQVRGRDMAMIFQDPSASLDPAFTVGYQLTEVLTTHRNVGRRDAQDRVIAMLEQVGITHAAKRLKDYPHQFSGGMRQRVMIAMALLLEPQVLLADEPTTALDVTTQAQILSMLAEFRESLEMSIVLITHDLAVVNELADRVLVMYAGEIVEEQSADRAFSEPLHPYTQGLLRSVPDMTPRGERLAEIGGRVPDLDALPSGCPFSPRCPRCLERCREVHPQLSPTPTGGQLRCINPSPFKAI